MEQQNKIDIIKDFIEYCKQQLQIENLPRVEFTKDNNWVLDIHSFGQYKNNENSLKVYIGNRNLADILRTLSHELVHHRQNELNLLHSKAGETGSDIENQANVLSSIIMRNYGKKNEMIYESSLTHVLDEVISSSMKLFVDMDGVLTDFEAQFDHYYGITTREYYQKSGTVMLKKAVDEIGLKFWSEMPYFPGAKELWNYVSKYKPTILSSPSTFKYAQQGKLIWIKNHLSPSPGDIVFKQTGQKESAISDLPPDQIKKCILIDDYYKNLAPWKALGGIGIVHKNAEQTISILKKFRL